MFTHCAIATAMVIGATLVLAVPAWGGLRYAGPVGAGDCSQASPCDLETAVEGASDGDEVVVAPGDYGSPGEPLSSQITATSAIAIHGPAGGPRPRLYSFSDSVFVVGAGASLSDLEIQHSGAVNALDVVGLVDRVLVQSPAGACTLSGDGAVLRNSVCWATQGSPAVRMTGGGAVQLPLSTGTLRNVTAYSRLGQGIRVTADNFAQLTISATNVITRGGFGDVRAEVLGSSGMRSADVNLDHSNFATRVQVGTGSVTAPGSGTNQTAPPMFVDDPLGDFHQLAVSPTVNAGIADAANGAFDFDGQARVQEASTDIGADELPTRAPTPLPVTPRATVDRTKPALSRLTVRPARFAVRRGTRVRYRLSEAATVTFAVDRAGRGRRSGSRCVLRRKTGRRCTRFLRLRGSFVHAGRAGTNSFRFSGRLDNRRLRRSRYRLVAVPRDAAGNRGKSLRASFRVVR